MMSSVKLKMHLMATTSERIAYGIPNNRDRVQSILTHFVCEGE